MKLDWKNPSLWVVLACFTIFLVIAISVVRSPVMRLGDTSGSVPISTSGSKTLPYLLRRDTSGSVPRQVTIDARNNKKWIYFNLSQNRIVHPRFVSSQNWDLAFKRYHVIANGGVSNLAANGGIVDRGSIAFEHVAVPNQKFVKNTKTANGIDFENIAIRHWYNYDYSSHILTPMTHVYVVRSPQDRYYSLRILDYYCPHGESGCMTFEYYRIR